MNFLALSLALAAVAVATAAVTAALVGSACRVPSLRRVLASSSALAAGAVLLPGALGLLSAVALAAPRLAGSCHCVQHGLHHPHLCIFHPELALPLLVPSAAILGAAAILAMPALANIRRALRDSNRLERAARAVEPELIDGIPVHLLDLGTPHAFTLGALRSVIVVDRALWAALSAEERRAVVHHESGHVERRDGLTLLALRALVACYPFHFAAVWLREWKRSAERACDRHAARILGDASVVARALLAVELARDPESGRGMSPALALGVAEPGELEERVLDLLEGPSTKAALGNDLLAAAIVWAGAAVLTAVWPGTFFHHAIETVLGLTVH